jgi:O-antigen ligase/polysaccharide polymerase Wzy-like membrane protein
VAETIAEQPVAPPRERRAHSPLLVDLIAFGFVLVPVVAALRLAGKGGGYTINEWGTWAVVLAIAFAVVLLTAERRPLHPIQLAGAGCLFGLFGWALLSIAWASWPENAVVEAARFLQAGCIVSICLLVLPRPGVRRAAVALAAGAVGMLALLIAYGLWRGGASPSDFMLGRLVGSIGYGGGMAAAVAVGVWPLVALASDRASGIALRVVAGMGAGAAMALVVPTGARAAVGALALSALVFFVLCPTPLRSGLVAGPAVIATALQWTTLNAAFVGGTTSGEIRSVGRAVVLVAVVGAVTALVQALIDTQVQLHGTARQAAGLGVAVVVVAAAGLGVGVAFNEANGHPLGWAQERWQSFQQNGNPYQGDAETRFTSVGGGRYDLWRVAVRVFHKHPLDGIGAGNFARAYYEQGRSRAQPQQAHSEPLEVAATLGMPGLLLWVGALGLPIAAAVITRMRARLHAERLLAAGVAAGIVEFAAHSSVDWTWQIAADSIPAFILCGVALAGLPLEGREMPWRVVRVAARPLIAALVVLSAVVVTLPATFAQESLLASYGRPGAAAIAQAVRAGRYDRLSSRPLVAQARAQLHEGDAAAALTSASRAVSVEPDYWVGWQLEFLAARRLGDGRLAAAAQAQVRRLNPALPLDLRFQIPPTAYDHY